MSFSSLGVLPSSSALASVQLLTPSSGGLGMDSTAVIWRRRIRRVRPQATQSVSPASSTAVTGFSLSPATEPFPQKLVDKVRSGQFVEMRDMLTDNIALKRQMEFYIFLRASNAWGNETPPA